MTTKYDRVFTSQLVPSPRFAKAERDAFDDRFVSPEFSCVRDGDTVVITHLASGRIQHVPWSMVLGAQPVEVQPEPAPIPSEPTRVTGKRKS